MIEQHWGGYVDLDNFDGFDWFQWWYFSII
jgi:hypothetical protein